MGAGELVELAGQFGPMGLLVGYLVWRENRAEKLAEKRIEVDKELAGNLAVLSAIITSLVRAEHN